MVALRFLVLALFGFSLSASASGLPEDSETRVKISILNLAGKRSSSEKISEHLADAIVSAFKKNKKSVASCFRENERWKGELQFALSGSGRASEVAIIPGEPFLECVKEALEKIEFPKHSLGKLTINFELDLDRKTL